MIKAIAFDMDGTFLNSNNDYDRERFDRYYDLLTKKDIKIIVASGNQYYQLKSFFPNQYREITFLSENGAIVTSKGKMTPISHFENDVVQSIITGFSSDNEKLEFVLCGVKNAYLLKNSSKNFKDFAKKYYYNLEEVENFNTLPEDTFVKIALEVSPTITNKVVLRVRKRYGEYVEVVSSGHGSIDIVIPGINKGTTLNSLLSDWDISKDEILVFGDSNNDIEMLSLTKNSYAMGNANNLVKQKAVHIAPSNDDSGVMEIIKSFL
ncbi:Cof-type HAD-IIB family hydrolase [Lactococcus lactis]|uniref:Cof-type HAD-IIB family hydrolase n=1 Tax=Lactococcus lactis TaxID=1358 RepID=UPI0024183F06|nr:Cof-type HAD-IIB family hydrolase [Lactococcus lactis]MDG4990276.1 Cof-type HAD-IIB family hydrolase [Lactococcus lactis]